MDLLKDAAKQINLYEVKHYVRKAQNVAMNLTDMEAKVREATNNEPWGTSSTVKAQIAAGTYNYREREEVLSFIFRRFTEKAANEWRQIYKSLELLDYLIKNGSERIIDDVRANMSLIQMLKSFHYIDSKGRDQGINVRNRAKNLLALLNDDALIRSERKKARANAKKFGGVSSAAYGGAGSFATGQGAAGFEDDDYSSRVFGDGGVYGARYGDTAEEYGAAGATGGAGGDDDFEEYEAAPSSSATASARGKATTATTQATASAEPDLLGDLMDFGSSAPATSTSAAAGASSGAAADDDDEFDDFQTAPSASAAPVNNLSHNLANLYVSSPTTSQQPHQQQQQQSFFQASSQPAAHQSQANYHVNSASSGPAKPAAPKEDAFSSLFSSAKTKTQASAHSKPATPKPAAASAALDDDFFSSPAPASSTSSAPAPTNTTTTNNNNGNDIDLLSF